MACRKKNGRDPPRTESMSSRRNPPTAHNRGYSHGHGTHGCLVPNTWALCLCSPMHPCSWISACVCSHFGTPLGWAVYIAARSAYLYNTSGVAQSTWYQRGLQGSLVLHLGTQMESHGVCMDIPGKYSFLQFFLLFGVVPCTNTVCPCSQRKWLRGPFSGKEMH